MDEHIKPGTEGQSGPGRRGRIGRDSKRPARPQACGGTVAGVVVGEGVSPGTPSTNRGFPVTGGRLGEDAFPWARGRFDYLKVTVFAEVGEVCDRLAMGVIERFLADRFAGWADGGPGRRISHVWRACDGLVEVVEYADGGGYCSVEVKGEACGLLGNEGVACLLDDVGGWRYQATRCDFAWDTFPLDPFDVAAAARAGMMRSRVCKPECTGTWQSATGRTCYVQGVRERAGSHAKFYNKRGPVRAEVVLRKADAKRAVDHLATCPVDQWPAVMMGAFCRLVEFVDREACGNVSRAPRLPWWAQFVESCGVVELPRGTRRQAAAPPTPVGQVEAVAQRAWKLLAAMEAFGVEYVVGRLRLHAAKRGDEVEAFRRELERWRFSGLAGLPDGSGENIPF